MDPDTTWSFVELRQLVDSSLHDRLNAYCGSFHYKMEFSDYHAFKAKEISDAYHNQSKIVLGGEELGKPFFEFEGHIIPMMIILHSAADTFAQILNICLNNRNMDEKLVSLKGIARSFANHTDLAHWHGEIISFLTLPEFRYLDGFVNTLKHRHLLKQEWTMEMKEGGPLQYGFRFDSFKYKNQIFSKKWGTELIELRRPIRGALVGLGRKINQHVSKAA